MRKQLAAALIVALSVSAGFAQNARLNAMGGYYLFGDITDVLFNPAYIVEYQDMIQGTYYGGAGGNLGPVIGAKSIGDMLTLGFSYVPGAVIATDAVPHVLLGIGLEKMSIGLDLFFERDWLHEEETDIDNTVPPAVTTINETKAQTWYMGAMAGLSLDLDAVALAVQLYAGLPHNETYTFTSSDAGGTINSTEITTSLTGNIDLGGYVDAGFEVGDYYATAGVTADFALYNKTETVQTDVVAGVSTETTTEGGTDDLDVTLGIYGGLEKEFDGTGIKAGAMLDGVWFMVRTQPIDGPTYAARKDWTNTLLLLTRLGLEKEWTSLKRLDAVVARTGLAYGLLQNIDHVEGEEAGSSYEYRLKNMVDRYTNGFAWDLGVGATKGILTADLEISPTAIIDAFGWANGNFAANDFASLTVTIDFKNIGKSHGSAAGSSSEEAPASAPAEGGLTY